MLSNRFWFKVDKTSHAPCWCWRGALTPKGYGLFWMISGMQYAHHLSYEDMHGPIQDKYDVHHICNLRRCVNPDHMQVTPHDHHSRKWGRRRV
jgi:hypothetical protein